MITVKNENCVFFDVDDTLVAWHPEKGEDTIDIVDPYTGAIEKLVPIERHITFLKRAKGRGKYVIVWSHGGWEWAEAVVKQLGLEQYVDVVMTKVEDFVDDVQWDQWTVTNLYLWRGLKGKVKR